MPTISDSGRPDERLRLQILRLIEERGVLRKRFGEAAGRGSAWATAYLKGDRKFPLDRLDQVAKFFGTTSETLLAAGGDGRPEVENGIVQSVPPKHPLGRPQSDSVFRFPTSVSTLAPQLRSFMTYVPNNRVIYRLVYSPPDWKIEKASTETPSRLIEAERMIGLSPKDYWPAGSVGRLLACIQGAWETGHAHEALLSFELAGSVYWRRIVYRKEGDYVTSETVSFPPR